MNSWTQGFAQVYRQGLWIAPPLFILGALGLITFILNIVRLERRSKLLSVPVRDQWVEFHAAEPVVLCITGPRFTTRFGGLEFDLLSAEGRAVAHRRLLFRPTTSGFS